MKQVTVNLKQVRVIAVVPVLKSMPTRFFKVIDDGATPCCKLENGCLLVRRCSFSSSTQLNGWFNLGRIDRFELDSLIQPQPLWSDWIAQRRADDYSGSQAD